MATIDLNDAVFGVEVNEHLVHMGSGRKASLKTSVREHRKQRGTSEVSGGGRKPWRQKGTGHASSRVQQGSAVDRWWSGICSDTERLLFPNEQERKRECSEVALTSRVAENSLLLLTS